MRFTSTDPRIRILEDYFKHTDQYPSPNGYRHLKESTNLSISYIRQWMNQERRKFRKRIKASTEMSTYHSDESPSFTPLTIEDRVKVNVAVSDPVSASERIEDSVMEAGSVDGDVLGLYSTSARIEDSQDSTEFREPPEIHAKVKVCFERYMIELNSIIEAGVNEVNSLQQELDKTRTYAHNLCVHTTNLEHKMREMCAEKARITIESTLKVKEIKALNRERIKQERETRGYKTTINDGIQRLLAQVQSLPNSKETQSDHTTTELLTTTDNRVNAGEEEEASGTIVCTVGQDDEAL